MIKGYFFIEDIGMDNIFLCQPDGKKGCSACCGLLNLSDISPKNLTKFLSSFDERKGVTAAADVSWAEKLQVRDSTSHICPYQGFIDMGRPGCMVIRELSAENGRDMSIFGAGVCGDYFCPAHSILDDEYRRILTGFTDDWYLYTISIADPESFIWIVDTVKRYSGIDRGGDGRIKDAISSAVALHSEFLNMNKAPVFYYALSEYNLYKEIFTLNSKGEAASRRREMIIGAIKKILTV